MLAVTSTLGSGTFGRVYEVTAPTPIGEDVEAPCQQRGGVHDGHSHVSGSDGLVAGDVTLTAAPARKGDAADASPTALPAYEPPPHHRVLKEALVATLAEMPSAASLLPATKPREVVLYEQLAVAGVVPPFLGSTYVYDRLPPPSVDDGAGDEDGDSHYENEEAMMPCLRLLTLSERFGTSLHEYVCTNGGGAAPAGATSMLATTPEEWIMEVAMQLMSLLASTHGCGIMHRDIKPHNVLIDDSVAGFPLLRLCDTGAAKRIGVPPPPSCSRATPADDLLDDGIPPAAAPLLPGVPRHAPYNIARFYRPPELLAGSTAYGYPADVWAMAVTIVEVATVAMAPRSSVHAVPASLRNRGNGSRSYRLRAPTMPPGGGSGAPPVDAAGASSADLATAHIRYCSTLFHGATSDGAQLLHVMNALGTPTVAEMEGMALHPLCRQRLEFLVAMVGHRASAAARGGRTDAGTAPVASMDMLMADGRSLSTWLERLQRQRARAARTGGRCASAAGASDGGDVGDEGEGDNEGDEGGAVQGAVRIDSGGTVKEKFDFALTSLMARPTPAAPGISRHASGNTRSIAATVGRPVSAAAAGITISPPAPGPSAILTAATARGAAVATGAPVAPVPGGISRVMRELGVPGALADVLARVFVWDPRARPTAATLVRGIAEARLASMPAASVDELLVWHRAHGGKGSG